MPDLDDLLEHIDRHVEDMPLADALAAMQELAVEVNARVAGLRADAKAAGL